MGDTHADTLYIGGGTPSMLPPSLLEEIITAVSLGSQSEVTVEANPGTLSQDELGQLRAAGCNRLSVGMQSAHRPELELLGRRHRAEDVRQAVEWARQAGFENLSLDLMYGIPGQTMRRWADTITVALSLRPEHLSLYALSVEPRTAFDRWVKSGRLPEPDPDLARDMYELARNELAAAGYVHYEISNWARPGYQSKHNLAYWRNRSYLGVGASAWGHWPVAEISWRMRNEEHPRAYIERIGRHEPPSVGRLPISPACVEQEFIPRLWAMAETMFMGLRLVQEGVMRADFRTRFGVDPVEYYRPALEGLQAQGWMTWDEQAIRLSEDRLFVSNQVLTAFLPPQP
jgi:oxygen-independent coproporphyrinogen-3 oxidase